jgi:signal transduction histidine kinase
MLAITHPDDRAMNWALVQEVMCGERPSYRLEKRYVRKDGAIVHVAMTASLVRDSAGRPLHFIGQLQDIGAQKELERLRTEWASIVAHDLRQPVHVISMNARLAQNLSRRGGDVQECIDAITASTRRLDRMIGDLLDLSRVEVRDLPLNRVPADLPALARAAVARIAPDAGDRPIELDVRGDIPAVSIDPDRMAQALDNLLTNAIKYGAEGTPIKVDIELRDDEVAVAVRSEGPGLGPEAMATLFQRFRRAATNGKVKGVGLGLYITRGLIEAHGGRIGVESSPTGPTVFRFTLPVG